MSHSNGIPCVKSHTSLDQKEGDIHLRYMHSADAIRHFLYSCNKRKEICYFVGQLLAGESREYSRCCDASVVSRREKHQPKYKKTIPDSRCIYEMRKSKRSCATFI